jgi:hypothetical protein
VALLAVQVPEDHRAGAGRVVGDAQVFRALQDFFIAVAGHGQAGHIALHVGHEHRHAQFRESLGQGHQGDGLAGAGGSGDQSMAVAEPGQKRDGDIVGDAFA